MKKTLAGILVLLISSTLLLSACGPSEESLKATAAAETLNAISIQETAVADVLTKLTQTYEAQEPTEAPATATAIPTLPQPDQNSVPTNGVPMPAIATNTPPLPSGGASEKAAFVTETIPDGTNMTPGQTFTKTWRLKNDGSSTWSTQYALVFVDGEQLGDTVEYYLPVSVPPGQIVDISVEMKAPDQLGKFRSDWKLRSASGALFGIGSTGTQPIWVEIEVVTAPTGTIEPTNTPDPSVTFEVTAVSVTGQSTEPTSLSCGDGFILTVGGTITTNTSGEVAYKWAFDGTENSEEKIEFNTAETLSVYASEVFSTSSSGMTVDIQLKSTTPNAVISQISYIVACN